MIIIIIYSVVNFGEKSSLQLFLSAHKMNVGHGDMEQEEERERMVEKLVHMWGYLPGALPQRAPIPLPFVVAIPAQFCSAWKDVCGGGCGFAVAISGIQSYLQLVRKICYKEWHRNWIDTR